MGIRVLVVDDSALMRKLVTSMLEDDAEIHVVGTARNGLDAIRRVHELNPDVVTMDIEMPELDGIAALKRIMVESPRPVIMLSSLTSEGAEATMDALKHGAVDFLPKPGSKVTVEVAQELKAKVKAAASVSVRHFNKNPITRVQRVPQLPQQKTAATGGAVRQLVAIGTSTGGPKALEVVLRGLPAEVPAPILIVQHMPPKFTSSLANRLNNTCAMNVVEAKHNQILQNGVAYIAPGGFHMTVKSHLGQYRIVLNEDAKRNEHRPSVDVLFESVAALPAISRHLVLMTGMGSDGATGMALAKESGAATTAESKSTCVVYGMPKAAVEQGCVDQVVPLHRIAHEIINWFAKMH